MPSFSSSYQKGSHSREWGLNDVERDVGICDTTSIQRVHLDFLPNFQLHMRSMAPFKNLKYHKQKRRNLRLHPYEDSTPSDSRLREFLR